MNPTAEGIYRVSAGKGGESLLILGSEKTAVYDTGMAYCGQGLVENIKNILLERPLDYVLLSHTHYDHVGGLPYLRTQWPDLITYGSTYGQYVLKKPGALTTIRHMSEIAALRYQKEGSGLPEYRDEDLRIDIPVGDEDVIQLGERSARVIETKGHTNCSLSYYLEEERILFASESTGVAVEPRKINAAFLTSYADSIASIEACRRLSAAHIFCPHYLQVEEDWAPQFFDLALEATMEWKDFILSCLVLEKSVVEIEEICREKYWIGAVKEEQPLEAFLINLRAKIKVVAREFHDEMRELRE
jgi:glyoxylase-like metal-dependent hydrolase (beta-lactamase superfamily II)